MYLFPAIDLIDGKAVRLLRGATRSDVRYSFTEK